MMVTVWVPSRRLSSTAEMVKVVVSLLSGKVAVAGTVASVVSSEERLTVRDPAVAVRVRVTRLEPPFSEMVASATSTVMVSASVTSTVSVASR